MADEAAQPAEPPSPELYERMARFVEVATTSRGVAPVAARAKITRLPPPTSRTAPTPRIVGGRTTAKIARAYCSTEPTIAQRIVLATRAIARAGVPFEVPESEARADRFGPVLGVIDLIFNESCSATSGEDWLRPELCDRAKRNQPGAVPRRTCGKPSSERLEPLGDGVRQLPDGRDIEVDVAHLDMA